MASDAFKEIMAGLESALAYAKGDKSQGVEHRVRIEEPDVKTVRGKLGLSQEDFAAAFGVPLGTLRHWEQGLRRPEGAARVLLKVIDVRPDIVAQVLTKPAARSTKPKRAKRGLRSA